jgi:putative signal transducing protein
MSVPGVQQRCVPLHTIVGVPTLLTTVHGTFSAHVLAARLHSEGIDVELRGAVGSPYGLTVGDMARVDLYVPEDQVDDARLVLLAAEIDEAMDLPGEDDDTPPRRAVPSWVWVAAVIVLVVAVAAPVLRWIVDA